MSPLALPFGNAVTHPLETVSPAVSGLFRHIRACNNACLPGAYAPFHLAGVQVGWVDPHRVPQTHVADEGALNHLLRDLAARGMFRLRDEAFDIRAEPDGPVLARIDRGAIPLLGCLANGVHLNGLVRRADGLWLWVGRRADDKPLDPGKLDHLAAGGVPAGYALIDALCKEAGEEAGLPEDWVRNAIPAGTISYHMERDEGLRRDRLHVYDLFLPENFQPNPIDGEVTSFALWPLRRVWETVRDTDQFKFNVNLVLIDLFLRHGLIDPDSADGQALRSGLQAGPGSTAR